MSTMEDSLRRALDGGDASDPAFRESIYAASERALERMLETRQADETVQYDQRSRLAATINRVEADYAPWPADTADDAADDAGGRMAYGGDDAPSDDWDGAHGADESAPDTHVGANAARPPRAYAPAEADDPEESVGETWTPGGGQAAPKGRARSAIVVPLAAIVFALLLAVLAYAVAGAVRGGDGAATPAAAVQPSDAISSTLAAAPAAADGSLPALAWIDVFDGNELEALSTPNGGRIETIAKPDEREAVRVSAPSGADGEVLLTMGAGVMRRISGHQVRLELTAGSPNAALREFGIRCLAGDESFCDRQRFSTAMSEEAFVFDVSVPPGLAEAGSIAIGPGLNGTPNDVDLYSVRIRQLD